MTSTKTRPLPPTGAANRFAGRINQIEKPKKINFIKRKLRDWLLSDESDYSSVSVGPDSAEESFSHDDAINFNVISAAGGRIVQVRYYDPKKDRHTNKLHLVTPDEDLATALAHILAIESISR